MISTLCFMIVNITLFIMLISILRNKGNIGIDFIICLIFTFLGNVFITMGINTIISLVNVFIGLKALEK